MSNKLILSVIYSIGLVLVVGLLYHDYQTLRSAHNGTKTNYSAPLPYPKNEYIRPTTNLFVADREWQENGNRDMSASIADTDNKTEKAENATGEWTLRAIVFQGGEYIAWIERPGLEPLHYGYAEGDILPDNTKIQHVNENSITVVESESGEASLTRLFPIK
ncbi:hypothetical protein [Motilimonas sp. KMU-193]|uniref:hypothetical protein n=1 Tax=Motilimonas sp. KMU-193 TaxID=3388668 RepID=UPI00396B1E02